MRKEHIIKALFKVETATGFASFADMRQFEDSGGAAFVALDGEKRLKRVPYSISLMPLEDTPTTGYHLMTFFGFRTDADPYHWPIIEVKTGNLSYHLPERPDAGDGTVHAS